MNFYMCQLLMLDFLKKNKKKLYIYITLKISEKRLLSEQEARPSVRDAFCLSLLDITLFLHTVTHLYSWVFFTGAI